MSLFQCCKCGCAEDSALSHYWSARVQGVAPVCSACDPKIGKWHGEFEQVPFGFRFKSEVEQWLGMALDIPESAPSPTLPGDSRIDTLHVSIDRGEGRSPPSPE